MIQQFKNISKKRYQIHLAPAFLTTEALVASLVFAVLLTGTLKIIERQNAIYFRTLIHQRIYNVIAQDSKAIRHYGTMWNSSTVDYEKSSELSDDMLYISSINCMQFNRRGALESAHRSDSFNYNRIFPYAPKVHENNVVIETFSDVTQTTYRIKRTYVSSGNNPNLETDPYTLRVKYSVETVNANNKVTAFPFEHTVDVNLIAQYSC